MKVFFLFAILLNACCMNSEVEGNDGIELCERKLRMKQIRSEILLVARNAAVRLVTTENVCKVPELIIDE